MVKIGERGEQHKAYDATFPHTYNHGTDHYTICTVCLHINLEEAAITCSRNQSDPTSRVTGVLQAPFPSCQQTFFFGPCAFQCAWQRRAWTFRYVVEGQEDQALRVVLTAVQHVPIFQALSVATSSSECIRYEHYCNIRLREFRKCS